MSGALMNKVWDLFGMDSAEPEGYEEENVYDYDDEEEEVEDKKEPARQVSSEELQDLLNQLKEGQL